MKKKEHLLRKQYLKLTISSHLEKRNIIYKLNAAQISLRRRSSFVIPQYRGEVLSIKDRQRPHL